MSVLRIVIHGILIIGVVLDLHLEEATDYDELLMVDIHEMSQG